MTIGEKILWLESPEAQVSSWQEFDLSPARGRAPARPWGRPWCGRAGNPAAASSSSTPRTGSYHWQPCSQPEKTIILNKCQHSQYKAGGDNLDKSKCAWQIIECMSNDDKNNIWAKVLAPENWALKSLQNFPPNDSFPRTKDTFSNFVFQPCEQVQYHWPGSGIGQQSLWRWTWKEWGFIIIE